MNRTFWAVPVLGAAIAVVGYWLPPAVSAVVAAAALGLVIAITAPPVLALGIPFLLVQVAGDGARMGLPLPVTQLSYALVLVAMARRARHGLPRMTGRVDRAMAALFLTFIAAGLLGAAAGSPLAAIKEDAVPAIFLFLTYGATRVLVRSEADLAGVLAVILTGSVLATGKVAYLLAAPVPVGWEGPWQAVRVTSGGATRLILRGADVFFVVSTLVVLARVAAGRSLRVREILAGVVCLWAVVIAGTRSNWVGGVAGGLFIVVAGVLLSFVRVRRAVMALSLAGALAVSVFVLSSSVQRLSTTFIAATAARSFTLDFRQHESAGVLPVIARGGGLGSGLGATYTYWDIGVRQIVRTAWSHNAYLQLLLTTGVLGLVVFLFVACQAGTVALSVVRRRRPWADRVLGLYGATVAVLVLSMTVNKIFDLSGAMFLGFAFAAIQAGATEEAEWSDA